MPNLSLGRQGLGAQQFQGRGTGYSRGLRLSAQGSQISASYSLDVPSYWLKWIMWNLGRILGVLICRHLSLKSYPKTPPNVEIPVCNISLGKLKTWNFSLKTKVWVALNSYLGPPGTNPHPCVPRSRETDSRIIFKV